MPLESSGSLTDSVNQIYRTDRAYLGSWRVTTTGRIRILPEQPGRHSGVGIMGPAGR
jgi:hypothetical protein